MPMGSTPEFPKASECRSTFSLGRVTAIFPAMLLVSASAIFPRSTFSSCASAAPAWGSARRSFLTASQTIARQRRAAVFRRQTATPKLSRVFPSFAAFRFERSRRLFRELRQHRLVQLDAALEVLERKIFIRRVRPAIRQGQSQKQSFGSENVAELRHDWDAASLANHCGLFAEGFLKRALSGFSKGGARVGQIPRPAVTSRDFHRHAGWQMLFQMPFGHRQNLVALLVGHEPESQLRHRMAGDDGFRTHPLVTAADTVDLSRWAAPNALERGVTFFTEQFGDAGLPLDGFVAINR